MKSRPATTELPPLPAVDSVSVTTVTETPGDTVQATQIAAPQARSKKEATREDIDALFKEATDLFD